ncbi:MAG: hexitol phosphatase HxpB [Sphingobacteriia bacterium]|nr:hexitol phosphatase HxpB [Sphingobacteriia bacterium]
MELNTVIFDIDGLLIDSEPLWEEATKEVFEKEGLAITHEQYVSSTGLRTKEFVDYWLRYLNAMHLNHTQIEAEIVDLVLQKIKYKGCIMPGVPYIFDFFRNQKFKIGLATSSPQSLIDLVIEMAGLQNTIQCTASAEHLSYGKPHPQVYLNCAAKLQSNPLQCLCFEDSFNGMIAAKAARMKCVVVPHHHQIKSGKFGAADMLLSSLQNFNALHLEKLNLQ